MTQQHLITPPPELVQHWSDEALTASGMFEVKMKFAALAAQWGANQELEACIDWISVWHGLEHPELLIELLRAARRPKPPNLKEQALEALASAPGPAKMREEEETQRTDNSPSSIDPN
jgi:hypothetical protein